MKLLIADDEIQIREGLSEGIDWAGLGITQVLTAENGLDALELCRAEKPEILITDVRMPGIDGLELSRRAAQLYAPLRVIVLSGYSEFQYVQQALQLGAVDYLLKPIDIDELEKKVSQCCADVRREADESKLRTAYTEMQRRVKRRALLGQGKPLPAQAAAELRRELGLAAGEPCFLAVVSADDTAPEQLPLISDYIASALKPLERAGVRIFLEQPRGPVLYGPGQLMTSTTDLLRQWHQTLNADLKGQFGASVSLAISGADVPERVGELYEQAEHALLCRFSRGGASFLPWPEVQKAPSFTRQLPLPREELEQDVKNLQPELADACLGEFFRQYRDCGVSAAEPLTASCMELKSLLTGVLRGKGVSDELPGDRLPEFVTADGYEAWAKRLCEDVILRLRLLSGKGCSREIMRAADFIQKNFRSDISLEDAAEYVQKSRNYFSSLFKREMGMSFVDYVNHLRIREACRLFDTTNELTYEVAMRVGFSSYKYFSAVFKKEVGCSPSAYRKQSES
jgi:two-component system response regulator YesN